MSTTEPAERLSLIPYDSEHRQVVLRHKASVVVFDRNANELSLRATPSSPYNLDDDCPYCHRPWPLQDRHDDPDHHRRSPGSAVDGFVNPDYFRMLAHTLPDSPTSTEPAQSRPPFPALRSTQTGNLSHASVGADFVGSAPQPQSSTSGISGSSFLPGYFGKFFVEKKLLGRGGRGIVNLVEHVLDGVSLGNFACKKIPVGNDHDWLAKVLVEVQLLQQLDHLNLVSYRHVWLEDAQINNFGPSVPCVFILQQYCNAGDLHTHVQNLLDGPVPRAELKRHKRSSTVSPSTAWSTHSNGSGCLALDEIFSFFKDITSGLHHLHTHGYIHRDLKPSNCLLHTDGPRTTVLVSDFGEVQAADAVRKSTGATGTISYCAPEVLRRDPDSGAFGNFSTSSDIFGLGMIVFYMCFGKLPYVNSDIDEEKEDLDLLRSEILEWSGFDDADKIRDDLPERLYRYLSRLLSLDPSGRPSTESILQGIKIGASGLDDTETPVEQHTGAAPNRFGRRSMSRKDSSASRSRPTETSPTTWRESMALSQTEAVVDVGSPTSQRATSPPHSSDVILSRRKLRDFTFDDKNLIEKGRLMLPPAPSNSHHSTTSQFWAGEKLVELAHSLPQAAVFLLKVHITLYSCQTGSPRSWLSYLLLTAAMVEFMLSKSRPMNRRVLATLTVSVCAHVMVLRALTGLSAVCVNARDWPGQLGR